MSFLFACRASLYVHFVSLLARSKSHVYVYFCHAFIYVPRSFMRHVQLATRRTRANISNVRVFNAFKLKAVLGSTKRTERAQRIVKRKEDGQNWNGSFSLSLSLRKLKIESISRNRQRHKSNGEKR